MAITEASKGTNQSVEWATPWPLFNLLHARFSFTLDPCATAANAKCSRFFTKEDDGLAQSWAGERVFCNPPYGRELPDWVAKAHREARDHGALVVVLCPPRTDTAWFHEHASKATALWLLRGRVRFENPENPADRPQDPSCIIAFLPGLLDGPPLVRFWDWRAEVGR